MPTYCKVSKCRFSHTHTTSGHLCGNCNLLGHGRMECRSNHKKSLLQQKHGMDVLPLDIQCNVLSCISRGNHTTEAHICSICGTRGGTCTCGHVLTRKCPICRVVSDVDLANKIFTGGECLICMEQKVVVVFDKCKHAQVCSECVSKLHDGSF